MGRGGSFVSFLRNINGTLECAWDQAGRADGRPSILGSSLDPPPSSIHLRSCLIFLFLFFPSAPVGGRNNPVKKEKEVQYRHCRRKSRSMHAAYSLSFSLSLLLPAPL